MRYWDASALVPLVADADVRVADHLSVTAGHDVAHAARDTLVAAVPRLSDATVHVGPAEGGTAAARRAERASR